jgi:hypothetical protein
MDRVGFEPTTSAMPNVGRRTCSTPTRSSINYSRLSEAAIKNRGGLA